MFRFLQWNYSELTFLYIVKWFFSVVQDTIEYLKILEDIGHVLHIFVVLYFIPRDWLSDQDEASVPYKLYILYMRK